MTDENLTFHEPTEAQLEKFHRINSLSFKDWELRCPNNCSFCYMAIHQWLLSREAHYCTYGISEEKFRMLMSSSGRSY